MVTIVVPTAHVSVVFAIVADTVAVVVVATAVAVAAAVGPIFVAAVIAAPIFPSHKLDLFISRFKKSNSHLPEAPKPLPLSIRLRLCYGAAMKESITA